jgi:MoaA/NifB/PqqE/SkfB family radical SAM enzyme
MANKHLSLKTLSEIRMLARSALGLSPACVYNYLKYKFSAPQETMRLSRFAPVLCGILITRRCNLKCSFCVIPQPAGHASLMDYEADIPRIQRIMEHPVFKNGLYYALTGGEPLLNQHVVDIVRLIRGKGHLVGISTNGMLLGDHLKDLAASGISQINVSLYDNNKDSVANVLPKANAVLQCRLSKVLLRSEVEDHPEKIEDAIKFSIETGLKQMYFMPCMPHGGSADEVIFDDNIHYAELAQRLSAKFEKCRIYWPTPLKRTLTRKDRRCRMLWLYAQADALGNLGLCCNYPTDGSGNHGNLFRDDPEKILNSNEMTGMRKVFLSRSDAIPGVCKSCPIMCDQWMSNY